MSASGAPITPTTDRPPEPARGAPSVVATDMVSPTQWATVALMCTLFAVYMSLVPLDFSPLPWSEALDRALAIRFLNLGAYSRADWIANGVVFAPIGFFWCAAATHARVPAWLAVLLVSLLATLGALALEFAQVYFAGRTRSLNDIYAECIGAAVGALAWPAIRGHLGRILDGFGGSLSAALRSTLVLYALLYLGLNLFPFDFVIALDELRARLVRDPITFFPSGCQTARCGVNVVVEILAAIPLGALLFAILRRPCVVHGALLGLVVGLVMEGLQILMISGQVEVISLLARMAGCALGAGAAQHLHRGLEMRGRVAVTPWLRPAALLLAGPYLIALMVANRWGWAPPADLSSVLAKLSSLSWMPLHYFYRAPEVFALQKLAYQSVMYAPVGVLYWAVYHDYPGRLLRGWRPSAIAALLALVMGAGRLALYEGIGPDPSNILVAAASSYVAWRLCVYLATLAGMAPRSPVPLSAGEAASASELGRWVVASGLALATLAMAATYPFEAAGLLILGLLAFAVANYARPRLWLFVIPAAVPILDRGLVTGLLLADELTLIMLTALASWLWREPYPGFARASFGVGRYLLWLMVAVVAWSAWKAVGLFPSEQWRSLAGMDGPVQTGRLLLAYVLAIALLPCLDRLVRRDPVALSHLALGFTLGLLYTGLALVAERYHFARVFDSSVPYRAAGPFSSMSTGGASLDVYLLVATAFTALGLTSPARRVRWLCALVLGLGAYAVVVTFTRTTYLAALAIAGIVLLLTVLRGTPGRRRLTVIVATMVVAAIVGSALLPEGFMRARLERLTSDLPARLDRVIPGADESRPQAPWSGAGLGTFAWAHAEHQVFLDRPARAVLDVEGRKHLVHLYPGTLTYFDQRVDIKPGIEYTVRARTRSTAPSHAQIYLCEKHILSSARCVSGRLPADGSGAWQRASLTLKSGWVGTRTSDPGLRPPTFLTLQPPGPGDPPMDLTKLSLSEPDGPNLLRAGRFRSTAGWYFTHDEHTAWHLKNFWASLGFEQGVFGVVAWALLTLYVIVRLARALGHRAATTGSVVGPVPVFVLAALCAVQVIGLTDAVLDASRMVATVLFAYGVAIAATEPLRGQGRRGASHA